MTKKCQPGFTLIELLTATTVAALLLALALPGFRSLTDNRRLNTFSDELSVALNLARSEALKRADRVTLCPANAAADNCGADWSGGWLVFAELDPPLAALNGRDEVLRHFPPLPARFSLSYSTAAGPATVLSYTAPGGTDRAGSFVLCRDARLEDARVVNVFLSGHTSPGGDENNNGIPENALGRDLSGC